MTVEKKIYLSDDDRKAIHKTIQILKAINQNECFSIPELDSISSGAYRYGNIVIDVEKKNQV